MPHEPSSQATIRIRIICGEEIAMGLGKADLLEAIQETGSISAAARRQGLSYRKAWLMVDEMNRCFARPVVDAAKGGAKGGGTRVTADGLEALRQYRAIQARAQAAIAGELREFQKLVLASPRKP
jgi:molybdate transport system regulatory protein